MHNKTELAFLQIVHPLTSFKDNDFGCLMIEYDLVFLERQMIDVIQHLISWHHTVLRCLLQAVMVQYVLARHWDGCNCVLCLYIYFIYNL